MDFDTDIHTAVPTNYGDWIQKFGETWKSQVSRLQARFSTAITEVRMPGEQTPNTPTDVPIIYVKKESIVGLLSFMKTEQGLEYNFLADLTAVDEEAEPRFEMVYNLYSMVSKARIRVKVRVAEGEEVPTIIPVWPGANWAEREVYDMFGIKFTGHPDLRRILMDERWVGHPLRKDFPLRSYQLFTEPMEIHTELLE
jgi:NADH-quinone oxidoreductase subunit C